VVVYRLAIGTLAKAIDLWAERYRGAIFHFVTYDKPGGADPKEALTDPLTRDQALESWLFRSDLRHAGSLATALALKERETAPEADVAYLASVTEEIAQLGSYPRPSAMQAWGLEPIPKEAARRLAEWSFTGGPSDSPLEGVAPMSRDMPAGPAPQRG
jgi:hypothetical protein